MAQRVPIAKALASGNSDSLQIRSAPRPFMLQASSTGWTGTVDVQHSVSTFAEVDDASADWESLAAMAPGDMVSVDHPLYRVRVNGTGILTGAASVYLLEDVRH